MPQEYSVCVVDISSHSPRSTNHSSQKPTTENSLLDGTGVKVLPSKMSCELPHLPMTSSFKVVGCLVMAQWRSG